MAERGVKLTEASVRRIDADLQRATRRPPSGMAGFNRRERADAVEGGGVLRPCVLSSPAGSAGTRTTYCTFTYTVTDAITGAVIATGVAPNYQRLPGALQAAGKGMYWMDGSTCVLCWCDERPAAGGCT